MAYRLFELHAVVGDDSNLQQVAFDRTATVWQVNDLEVAAPTIRVAPADGLTSIALGTIAQGYAICVFSDYPIRYKFNGGNLEVMTSNNSPATNVGAPLPAKCWAGGTFLVTTLSVQPIVSASQTANVWIVCTGDPTNAYT